MRKLLILFLLLSLIAPLEGYSQRRSTTVKSYYRKDGTYVRSHSRSYKSGSSKNTSSYIGSSYNGNSLYDSGKQNDNNVIELDLLAIVENDISNDSIPKNIFIDAYVLRYQGNILDINPISRDSYVKVTHEFSKDLIPSDLVIDLVSNFDWMLNNGMLSKSYYSYSSSKDPEGLVSKRERIYLFQNSNSSVEYNQDENENSKVKYSARTRRH